jgi:hypothetical protein
MPDMPIDISDPRVFPTQIDPRHASLIELTEAGLVATTETRAEKIERTLVELIADWLQSERAALLADVIASAPSPAVARALWRCLIDAWSLAGRGSGRGVAATLFALPVVIIAGREPGAAGASTDPTLSGIVADTKRLAGILLEHGALSGNETFALAPSLATAEAIDVPRLGALLAWQQRAVEGVAHDFPPTQIAFEPGQQSVHLRFLMGTALAAPGVDLLAASDVAKWGMPFALELARQLGVQGVSVLALPRSPQAPPAALQQGRAVQREVGAQLFASNAIRRLRASVGEPVGVISAHRSPASPGGGELRVSLSSPFDPRQAEGFRCPLFPTDRAGDVAQLLFDLLRDCRVTDVRVLAGVHPDRDDETGMLMLFKPEGLEPTLH